MTDKPTLSAKDLLLQALERRSEDRLTFIREACGTDEELRNEAERLLKLAQADVSARWRTYQQLASLDYSQSG